MSKVYLLKYNNYYNRIIKKEDSLTNYFQYLAGGEGAVDVNGNSNVIDNCNFIEGNYIQSSLVVNWVGEAPNYVVVSEDGINISSRWYVVNMTRENFAQNKLSLQRDVIVDHYNSVVQSPAFIEKGTPLNIGDSAIYNNESMTFNQIKTRHELLSDELEIPWVVGYIPQDSFKTAETVTTTPTVPIAEFASSYDDWVGKKFVSSFKSGNNVQHQEFTKFIEQPDLNDIDYDILVRTKTTNFVTNSEEVWLVLLHIPFNNPMNYRVYCFSVTYDGYNPNYLIMNTGNGSGLGGSDYLYVCCEIEHIIEKGFSSSDSVPSWANGDHCSYYTDIVNTFVKAIVGNWDWIATRNRPTSNGTEICPPFGHTFLNINKGMDSRFAQYKPKMWTKVRQNMGEPLNADYNNFMKYSAGVNINFASSNYNNTYYFKSAKNYYKGTNIKYGYTTDNSYHTAFFLNDDLSYTWLQWVITSLSNGTTTSYGLTWLVPVSDSDGINKITNICSLDSSRRYILFGYETNYDSLVRDSSAMTGQYSFVIPAAAKRIHMVDQPYDMFCIPLVNSDSYFTSSIPGLSMDKQMEVALQLSSIVGTDNVYDIQIVPYCPFRDYITWDESSGHYKLDTERYKDVGSTSNIQSISFITQQLSTGGTANAGIIMWASTSHFSFELNSPILDSFDNIQQKKIANETQFYRIVSPAGSSMFDFSAAKNDGLSSFQVDVLYTPYTPYIHIAPTFSGLYNKDFNDFRGMICSDDLSLPQVSNAWTDYQVQNKNYQLQYNRQVENLEISNDVERTQQKWEWAAGTVQGAMQGYQIGSQSFMGLGGLFGLGAAGAAAGGTFAYKAGEADYNASERLRNENLNYMKDMFQMSMQNIQALPSTITKGNILSPNFQYFPVLEKYECTEEEINALKSKLKFDGYTIRRFGTLASYSDPDNPYIQGYLIRYSGDDANFAMIDAINQELKSGVYINEYSELSS